MSSHLSALECLVKLDGRLLPPKSFHSDQIFNLTGGVWSATARDSSEIRELEGVLAKTTLCLNVNHMPFLSYEFKR